MGFTLEELEHMEEKAYEEEIKGIIALVRQYSEKYQYQIPVVVAGGVYEGKDLSHALALGADGVQAATRFVTTWECDASEAYKQAYLKAGKEDIQIVKSPVGMPGRAIRNEFIDRSEQGELRPQGGFRCHQCLEKCNQKDIPYCITDALINAVKGDLAHGLIFCGANAWRSTHMEHVPEIMAEFAKV